MSLLKVLVKSLFITVKIILSIGVPGYHMNLGEKNIVTVYIMIVYIIETKENFSRKQFFCISLSDELRKFIHPSLNVYVVKNPGRIHLTSQSCFIFEILNTYVD